MKQALAQVQNDSKKLAGQKHVEHLTESNQALKQQLHLLHSQAQRQTLARKAVQVTLGIAATLFTALLFGTFVTRSTTLINIIPFANNNRKGLIKEKSEPVSIPYIKTEQECKDRKAQTIWEDGKCYDLEYSRNY